MSVSNLSEQAINGFCSLDNQDRDPSFWEISTIREKKCAVLYAHVYFRNPLILSAISGQASVPRLICCLPLI